MHTLDSPGVYSSPLLHAYSHCATQRGATPLPRKEKQNVRSVDGAHMKTEKKINKKKSAVDRPPHPHVQINDGRLQTQVTRHAAHNHLMKKRATKRHVETKHGGMKTKAQVKR